ncbi:glycerophosphodiester phosphodiesterase family protein [Tamlana crocina]
MNFDIFKIGHRGAAGHIAENTVESVKKAIELGATGIEVDVHVCASGELVVFHDFTLDRVTNSTGEIAQKTLSELKQLKVLGEFEIPTLDEVVSVLDNNTLLNIELKGQNTTKPVARFIERHVEKKGWAWRDFLVSSFQKDLLEQVYATHLPIMLGVLTDTNLEEALNFARQIQAVSIHPDYTMLTDEHVKNIQSNNMQVITYTVNDKVHIERLKAYGVDGIISDFPDRL